MSWRLWLTIGIWILLLAPASAQVIEPPPPAQYDVQLRYRIRATRNERIRQFLELSRALEAAGFTRGPIEPDEVADPNAERMSGSIAADKLPRLLNEPRVRKLLIAPAGFKLPDGDEPIGLRVQIAGGLAPDRQRLLHQQTAAQLGKVGFIERVGYDHRGSTRLLGTLPASALTSLLDDIRNLPGGWLVSDTSPSALPEPIRNFDPLRVIEVDPAGVPTVADATTPRVEPGLEKISSDLRAAMLAEGGATKPTRMEVVLYDPLRAESAAWKVWLAGAGTVTIEGQAGSVVTILAPAINAREIAALPQVATVRLPSRAADGIPSGPITPVDALAASNLDGLSDRGRGVTVAIIDNDFAGWNAAGLNAKMLDLTAERNASLEPDPMPTKALGRGTAAALAARKATSQANIILVRVDAEAAHQVVTIARYLSGEAFRTDAMTVRNTELLLDNGRLRQLRDAINAERVRLSEDFNSDEATQARRIDLQKRLAAQEQDERAYERRLARFIALEESLLKLREVGVVACNLNWHTGFPVDGQGPLAACLDGKARLFDRGRGRGPVVWLQSTGDTHGQSWAGPWWDSDGNGVLEFAPRQYPLPTGKWTRELNFLGWQPHDGSWSPELPAGATVRVSLQWTEPHDNSSPVPPANWRTPLNDLRPVVVRQEDPSGQRSGNDRLNVIARAEPLAQMIDRSPTGATYEQVVEFTVEQPGRYGVRLEGRRAMSSVPAGTELPPAATRVGEVYPRVHVAVADAESRAKGRAVFIDFRSLAGGLATPADARSVVTIGAANALAQPQPYSARGAAPSLALIASPRMIAFDEFRFAQGTARGTGSATGFAAGIVAATLGAGGPAAHDLKWMAIPDGGLIRVPAAWLQQLQNTTGLRERAAYLPSPLDRPAPRNR